MAARYTSSFSCPNPIQLPFDPDPDSDPDPDFASPTSKISGAGGVRLNCLVRIFPLAKPQRSQSDHDLFLEAVDGSCDAVFHQCLAEVQEISQVHIGEPEISQELFLVGVCNAFN